MFRTITAALLLILALAVTACSGGDATDSASISTLPLESTPASESEEPSESPLESVASSPSSDGQPTVANDLQPGDRLDARIAEGRKGLTAVELRRD